MTPVGLNLRVGEAPRHRTNSAKFTGYIESVYSTCLSSGTLAGRGTQLGVCDQFVDDLAHLLGVPGQSEVFLRIDGRRVPHLLAKSWISQKQFDSSGESLGIPGRYQYSSNTFFD